MSNPTLTPPKLMTVDEFWDFVNRSENANRFFELRCGEVIEMSRPTSPHGIVCSRIGAKLQNYAEARGLGYVTTNDSGVVLSESPGTVVGPDVAYFTDVNLFDDVTPKWAETPPVLAVEVLSPNDKMSEVNEKIQDYLVSGVKVVWLADYEQKKVTVYRPDRVHTVLKGEAELTGGEELPGFTCCVADLFRLPGDRKPAIPAV
jgi:Uma2 family endonuclease